MLLLFFVVWIVFNGRLTWEIAFFGVAIAALVFAFVCKFMGYSVQREKALYKKIPLLCKYVALLIKEIVKANLAVCRMILSRREQVEPVIGRVPVKLQTETARVLLANSITLTPGTITVSLTEQELLVHCLDKTMAEGMEDSEFVKVLEKLEGVR